MTETLLPTLILAGGLATRLRPVTEQMPKSLVEVNNLPFIHHQLKLLEAQNIKEVFLCLGYLGEQVESYLRKHEQTYKLKIHFHYDGDPLLGTAGAIARILPHLPPQFFVIYGDSYLPCPFAAVQKHFEASHKLALMTVYKNKNLWDNSNVVFEQGEILCYDKVHKTPDMQYIDYGLGIFDKNAFHEVPAQTFYDLASLYQTLLQQDELCAFEVKERFYEIGSFQGIEDTATYLNQQESL